MSVAPRDLHTCAEIIRKNQTDEAGSRAVISRAYYAAYHAAYDFHTHLSTPGSVGKASGRHEQLIAQLSNPTIKATDAKNMSSRRLGHILRDVSRLRVRADYGIGALVEQGDADNALRMSAEILKICSL